MAVADALVALLMVSVRPSLKSYRESDAALARVNRHAEGTAWRSLGGESENRPFQTSVTSWLRYWAAMLVAANAGSAVLRRKEMVEVT